MKPLHFLSIFILFQVSKVVNSYYTLGTFTPNLPSNTYTLGTFVAGDVADITVTWTMNATYPIGVTIVQINNMSNIQYLYYANSPGHVLHTFLDDGNYSVQISCSDYRPIPYTLTTIGNGVTQVYKDVATSFQIQKGVYLYTILQRCTSATIETSTPSYISYFNFFIPSFIPNIVDVNTGCASYPASSNISTSFNQIGTYYMIPHHIYSQLWIMSSPTFYFNCYDNGCGNGILQTGESCDNGNISGCLSCVGDPLYNCVGNSTGITCVCKYTHLTYNTITKQCNINCAAIPYTNGLVANSIFSCQCQNNFQWSSNLKKCIINCLSIPNSAGSPGTIDSCYCRPHYYYDVAQLSCILNCSSIVNAIGYNFIVVSHLYECICAQYFNFNNPSLSCVINCSLISNAASATPGTIDQCTCNSGYTWTSSNRTCVADPIPPQICPQAKTTIGLSSVQIGLIIGICLVVIFVIVFIVIFIVIYKRKMTSVLTNISAQKEKTSSILFN